jgi:NADPH:quinone reductase-like Zn-dependent oxidoreductase
VSGVVEAVGADATEFAVGDEVIGYLRTDHVQHGTFAELVAAPVRTLARKPAALSWTEAAGLPLAGLTALQTLRRIGLKEGEKVLVHGGAGGVGSLGVQIARAFGARVIATASERNHEFLRSLGAEPVTYGPGLAERVREIAPNGVDAVADFIGGDSVAQSLPVVGDPTRVASIASDAAKEHGGHVVWARPDSADLAELAALADDGKLTVHLDTTLPLARTAEAFRLSMAGHVRGKVVIEVA